MSKTTKTAENDDLAQTVQAQKLEIDRLIGRLEESRRINSQLVSEVATLKEHHERTQKQLNESLASAARARTHVYETRLDVINSIVEYLRTQQ